MPENPDHRSRLEVPIPPELKADLRAASRVRGMTMSAAAREALRAFVVSTAANLPHNENEAETLAESRPQRMQPTDLDAKPTTRRGVDARIP